VHGGESPCFLRDWGRVFVVKRIEEKTGCGCLFDVFHLIPS
jgi:hypothetical protein